MDKPAINGGSPVREKPFPPRSLGASLLGDAEQALVTDVIQRQAPFRDYGMNPPHYVDDLEQEARAYLDVAHVLATSSGTGAILCAVAALGIGPGDEVIIPAFSWWSNYNAVVLAGGTPVFAEIDRSLTLEPDDFERRITSRTRAVMVIHFQGAPAQMNEIMRITRAHDVQVIEDVAQAAGGAYGEKKLGTIGDVGCFSFQQNKVITAGEGGLLSTNDALVFERAARYHDLGQIRKKLSEQLENGPSQSSFAGAQFRMSEITGAVALAQWRRLDKEIIGPTRKIWKDLQEKLTRECPNICFRPSGDDEGDIGIALYMDLETPDRAGWFSKALAAEGIPVGPTSSVLNMLHTELVQGRKTSNPGAPPFGSGQPGESVQYDPADCPRTDEILETLVCIPIVPAYTDAEVNDIVIAVKKVWPVIDEG